MTRKLVSIVIRVLLAAALFQMLAAPGCDSILEDDGFDLWCGDELCHWDLEDGEIAKVPTWHQGDPGVALVGPSVAISQMVDIDQSATTCIRFEAVADVDESAEVMLELDFYDDGTVDYEERIPTSRWAPISYLITTPPVYRGIRFRLRKLGNGAAALAQIAASEDDKCVQPPLDLGARPLGMSCSANDQCDSGICYGAFDPLPFVSACSQCETILDCADGQICGLESQVPRWYSSYYTCVDAGSHVLGEPCADDRECATGLCAGVCTACTAAADCADGESCTEVTSEVLQFLTTRPSVCTAGGLVATGGFCLAGEQCASGTCTGTGDLRVCLANGRECSADSDCAVDITDLEAREGHCVVLGLHGGICD